MQRMNYIYAYGPKSSPETRAAWHWYWAGSAAEAVATIFFLGMLLLIVGALTDFGDPERWHHPVLYTLLAGLAAVIGASFIVFSRYANRRIAKLRKIGASALINDRLR